MGRTEDRARLVFHVVVGADVVFGVFRGLGVKVFFFGVGAAVVGFDVVGVDFAEVAVIEFVFFVVVVLGLWD